MSGCAYQQPVRFTYPIRSLLSTTSPRPLLLQTDARNVNDREEHAREALNPVRS
jgi:hypothetical protein